MSVNKVILVGNLGKDPEIRTLENGTKVASFSLATSETYKDKNGERKDQTEWHNIVVWRNLAEIAEKYLRKGTMVYIEGKLRTRQWEDQNNQKRYTTEIVADNFKMLGNKKENSDTSNPVVQDPFNVATGNAFENPTSTPSSEDDLPF